VDLANRTFSNRPSMTVFDASARFTPTGGRYTVSVWGRNLSNEVEVLGYTPVGATFAFAYADAAAHLRMHGTVNF
jgi:outer membrane receptor protein involved in Fe transport